MDDPGEDIIYQVAIAVNDEGNRIEIDLPDAAAEAMLIALRDRERGKGVILVFGINKSNNPVTFKDN